MTNSELLTAISEIFDAKLDARLKPVENRLEALDNRLASVENRLETLDDRLASVENRLEALDDRLEALENRLEALDDRLEALENRVGALDDRLGSLEIRVESLEARVGSLEIKSDSTEHSIASIITAIINIQLLLENQILPRLQTIESCYLDTYERYSAGADKIQTTIDDVDILKKVVHRHSELLQMTS